MIAVLIIRFLGAGELGGMKYLIYIDDSNFIPANYIRYIFPIRIVTVGQYFSISAILFLIKKCAEQIRDKF